MLLYPLACHRAGGTTVKLGSSPTWDWESHFREKKMPKTLGNTERHESGSVGVPKEMSILTSVDGPSLSPLANDYHSAQLSSSFSYFKT